MPRSLIIFLALALAAAPAAAHEYWIEPDSHRPEPGARVTAAMRVGQDFAGPSFPYLSHRFKSFRIVDRAGTRPVEGLEGDDPAVRIAAVAPGLTIIAYLSRADTATFESLDDFAAYLAYEGLADVADRHRRSGLPESGFSEDYVRCAKALIQAGPVGPDDRDRALGLPAELVALQNPFDPDLRSVDVRLTWQGAPVAGRQVAVFFRPADGGTVTRTLLTTDTGGVVTVGTGRAGRYLLNAVHVEPTGREAGTVWQSHWASLTFATAD